MTDEPKPSDHGTPETGDVVGLLNAIMIDVGTSLGDRNYICGRFAERAEQRGFCVQSLGAALTHAYADGRKDEAEEHTAPMLESLRHVHTTLASNIAFDMDGAPETGWDAVAAFLVRDIDTAIIAAFGSESREAANDC